jgi:hypothetical protein
LSKQLAGALKMQLKRGLRDETRFGCPGGFFILPYREAQMPHKRTDA